MAVLTRMLATTAFALVFATLGLTAQQPAQGQQAPPTQPARAPMDLTGTWVSVVTEDWRWRMVTPAKGDYAGVPLNPAGQKLADSWDLAKDAAEGNQCRAFGVGGIMRIPGRMSISWQDGNTLKGEFDAGTQARVLKFTAGAPSGEKTWQGDSAAAWDGVVGGGRGGGVIQGGGIAVAGGGGPFVPRGGSLKVVTTNMRPGYLRKNGVPYSDAMVLTEYFDRHDERDKTQWITVTSIVDDPRYLNGQFVTSTSFKKEPDRSKFLPTTCTIDPPRT